MICKFWAFHSGISYPSIMLPNFRVINLLNIFYSSFNNSNESSVSLFIRHSGTLLTLHCPFLITVRDHLNIKWYFQEHKLTKWGLPFTLHFSFSLEEPIRSVLRAPTTDSNFLAFGSYLYRTQWCSTEHTTGAPRTKDHVWTHIPWITGSVWFLPYDKATSVLPLI